MKLRTKGKYETTDELINNVFFLSATNMPSSVVKHITGVSEPTINKILEHFEPDDKTRVDIINNKIERLEKNNQNPDYLIKEKKELLKTIENKTKISTLIDKVEESESKVKKKKKNNLKNKI